MTRVIEIGLVVANEVSSLFCRQAVHLMNTSSRARDEPPLFALLLFWRELSAMTDTID